MTISKTLEKRMERFFQGFSRIGHFHHSMKQYYIAALSQEKRGCGWLTSWVQAS
ncbi:hypothetical protein EDD73_10391 [Heliophilum fasciatum]|uniref:Uncharacterized protein n=1 Tax=Heliophilum fasciatum TaxID=35700 RepID=A0A4R2RVM4_9FIRM|nr:hypothetical protein [Heliophilum fasciatum]TCP68460.1 hypothetical protein EDD73_10391 [Heliophilum fasciatum]